MSLRWFHVIFISICVVLSVLVAAWAVQHAHWFLALLTLLGGTVLVVYRRVFLEKARRLNLE